MSRQIVNTVKNKDFIGNILDKFLFSNSATFLLKKTSLNSFCKEELNKKSSGINLIKLL